MNRRQPEPATGLRTLARLAKRENQEVRESFPKFLGGAGFVNATGVQIPIPWMTKLEPDAAVVGAEVQVRSTTHGWPSRESQHFDIPPADDKGTGRDSAKDFACRRSPDAGFRREAFPIQRDWRRQAEGGVGHQRAGKDRVTADAMRRLPDRV